VESFSEKEISTFLSDRTWRNYQGTVKTLDTDSHILQLHIKNLLKITDGSLNNVMNDIRIKALSHVLGITGYTVFEDLPQKLAVSDSQTNEAKIEIPDFDSEKIVKFANWHQLTYLLYNLYVIVQCYWYLQRGRFQGEIDIDPVKLSVILNTEIQIILNSYRIRQECERRLLNLKSVRDLKAYLGNFIDTLISKDDYEYCIPCGSIRYVIYITLLYFKDTNEIRIRLDASGSIGTTVIGMVETTNSSQIIMLTDYLHNAVLQLNEEDMDVVIREIYNQGKPKKYNFKSCPSGYDVLQSNSTVEGFRRSIWYRLIQRGGTRNDMIYTWLTKKSIDFFTIPNAGSREDTFAKQIQLRDKKDNEKFMKETKWTIQNRLEAKRSSNLTTVVNYFKKKKLEELISHINSLRQAQDSKLIICAITGVAGCGKSELANAYAFHHGSQVLDATSVFRWRMDADATRENTYQQAYLALLYNLNLQFSKSYEDESSDRMYQRLTSMMWEKINQYSQWMVIFDDANSYEEIVNYLPNNSKVQGLILITTRQSGFLARNEANFSIDSGLYESEAVELLIELSNRHKEDRNNARELVRELDYSPLGIRVAARYIYNVEGTTFADYIQLLKTGTIERLTQAIGGAKFANQTTGNSGQSLHATLAFVINRVDNLQFQQLLQYCAYLANVRFIGRTLFNVQ
jgi:hypothetical protein